ncbi:reverse transcriptase domain-containing protein [Tanacetum coccineum]
MDATANLLKEDLISVPICVKLHDISIMAFTTDGLSVMANRLGRMDYAHALIDIRVDRELKDEMIIAIPNVEDDEEVLHSVRVEYEWEPPRCGVCMIFGHDKLSCPKWAVDKPKKQHTTYDSFQLPPRHVSRGTSVGPKVQYKPKKQVYQAVSKKNGVNSSGMKKNSETNSANPFDALNMIENDDELESNKGSINELESQMLDGKFVLVGDDGKPLKPCKSTIPSSSNVPSKKGDDPVNEDSDDEVLKVYNDTATFMVSTSSNVNEASKSGGGGGNKSLYEQWKEDHYEDRYDDDDFDDHGLTFAQMRFVDAFDISLRG